MYRRPGQDWWGAWDQAGAVAGGQAYTTTHGRARKPAATRRRVQQPQQAQQGRSGRTSSALAAACTRWALKLDTPTACASPCSQQSASPAVIRAQEGSTFNAHRLCQALLPAACQASPAGSISYQPTAQPCTLAEPRAHARAYENGWPEFGQQHSFVAYRLKTGHSKQPYPPSTKASLHQKLVVNPGQWIM